MYSIGKKKKFKLFPVIPMEVEAHNHQSIILRF